MSKYYEELLKLAEKDEEKVRKLLMQNYITSIVDMKKKLKEYMMINDGLTYAQQLEMKRLDSLIEQININIKKLYDNNYDTITKYDRETFEREYFGVFYEVENLANINLSFSMLNEKYVQEAIEFPIEGLKLSERLYDKHLMDMKYRVKGAVTQGLINSSGYAAIAKTISDIGFTNFNHAMTIAVTEAGRMKSLARQKGQEEAVSKGVDLQKKWLSTLDKKTRHSHQKLDGQTVPIDGEFEINGHKAPQPRLFGIAKEDIRCRCDTITIVEGIDPSLRRDNETREVTNFKNYTEWKQDKINKIGKEKYEIEEKKVRNTSSDKKQYARYKEILGKKVPKTLEGFQELKYNDIEKWESLKQDYALYNKQSTLQERLDYVINEEESFIPANTKITNVKIIAGNGSEVELRSKQMLSDRFGGEIDKWSKKVGKIESEKYTFDVHWNEYNGKQHIPKVKSRKEKKVENKNKIYR